MSAHRLLGELKGTAKSLPNQTVLIDTLLLQEALASSEIENIVTTQDEAFSEVVSYGAGTVEAKEVARYSIAMRLGYEQWRKTELLTEGLLIEMFRLLKQRDDGYRRGGDVVLRNSFTGEVIYKPPQNPQEIADGMRALEKFINDHDACRLDPLIKMALIHHQFESIHPFPDGNGRIGRILNVLYLTHTGLLDEPILYLSRSINRTKADYYRLLQAVRTKDSWEEWVIYMVDAVADTADSTLQLVIEIRDLMAEIKQKLRLELPKLYSQDLLNNLFRYPYTRIEFLVNELGRSRLTVTSYLEQLAEAGFVEKRKIGRNSYYINRPLVQLLVNVSSD